MPRLSRCSLVLLLLACPPLFAQDEGYDAGTVDSAPPPDSVTDEPAPIDESKIPRDDDALGSVQGELGAAIRQMIRLLEAGQHEAFLDRFLDPDEKAEALRSTTLEDLSARFARGKAEALLQILRSLRRKVPQFTSDGDTAAFVLDTVTDGVRDQIRFRRVDGAWYLRNR